MDASRNAFDVACTICSTVHLSQRADCPQFLAVSNAVHWKILVPQASQIILAAVGQNKYFIKGRRVFACAGPGEADKADLSFVLKSLRPKWFDGSVGLYHVKQMVM